MDVKCPNCGTDNTQDSEFCKKCGTQIKESEEEARPTQTLEVSKEELITGSIFAGRYQIIEELGKGGMGRVYRVEDKKTKEQLALKFIKPEISVDKKTIERFSNELRLAHKISHRNVCRMFHLGEEAGIHFITMEYVPGEDLKSMIQMTKQLTVGTAISIAKQLCDGLEEAHRLGVIHRDLKSSNIMIDKAGTVRIMDFGIARSFKTKGITGTGVVIGTPEYMSPEQIEGKVVDQHSDIYSLGIIIFELLTGKLPFEGDTTFAIGLKHKTEEPKDPRKFNPQIPEGLSRLILKCLEKEKENRFHNVGEVRSELTRIEEGIPITEREVPKRKPITAREITVKLNLKKIFVPILIVLALVMVTLIIWQPWSKVEVTPISSNKPSLVILNFKNSTGDNSLDIWRSGLCEMLITDLSQSRYIKVLSRDRLYSILKRMDLQEKYNFTSEELKKIAAETRATHLLQGTLTRAADKFRIDTTIQETNTLEIISSARTEGIGEGSFFSMADELTEKTKVAFKLSVEQITQDINKDISEITTNSYEALKYYIESEDYFNEGKFRESIEVLRKAVSIDPKFAMAYSEIGVGYSYLGFPDKANEYLTKALQLINNVSLRERYYIQAMYSNIVESDIETAIKNYQQLLVTYPDDEEGILLLGAMYRNLRKWDLAFEQFEKVLKINSRFDLAYFNLMNIYRKKGLYDKAIEILEKGQQFFPDNFLFPRYMCGTLICQGKYDLALLKAKEVFSIEPDDYYTTLIIGCIHHLKDEFQNAQEYYQKPQLLSNPDYKTDSRYYMGHLFLSQGKFNKCVEEFERGVEESHSAGQSYDETTFLLRLAYLYLQTGRYIEAHKKINQAFEISVENRNRDYQIIALHLIGSTYLKMNKIEEAEQVAVQLKDLIQQSFNKYLNKDYHHCYHHLMGTIAIKKKMISQSVEYIQNMFAYLPAQEHHEDDDQAFFLDSIASAYYLNGELDKASIEYERIVTLTTGRFQYGDIYAKSFYMLGKIYEQKGLKNKAEEYYEKFLSLWQDADPGIAEVEDARKSLAGLKGL